MHEPYMSHNLVRTSPFCTSPFCRIPVIADPEKCFQELISEKLLIFFAGWALCGINYRFQSFSGFTPLAWQITGIGLKAINSSKKVLKITGPALFRINSVIISARTVCCISWPATSACQWHIRFRCNEHVVILVYQENPIDPWPRYVWKLSRYTPPFLSRYFGESMPSSWQKVVYTPPICITIRLVSRYASHLHGDTSAEVLGSGVVGTPPRKMC